MRLGHSARQLTGASRSSSVSLVTSVSSDEESSPLFGAARPLATFQSPDGRTDLMRVPSSPAEADESAEEERAHGLTELARYYVPSFGWLPTYNWAEQFPTDFLAGLTVSVLIIPQAIAYSGIAGLPPAYGLYTSIFPALIYFLLGSCRQMSVGPESTSAILLGHVLSKMLAEIEVGNPGADVSQMAVDISFRVTFLSGCLCLGMGLARVGFVDSILSQPILEGFVSAVACLLLTDQIPKLLGLPMGDGEQSSHTGKQSVQSHHHRKLIVFFLCFLPPSFSSCRCQSPPRRKVSRNGASRGSV